MTVNDLAKPWPECLPRRFAPFLVHRSQYRSLTSGLPSFVPRPVEPSLHDVIVLADAAGLPAATIHGIDLAESCLDHPRRRSVEGTFLGRHPPFAIKPFFEFPR